jgi:hypothetical protein
MASYDMTITIITLMASARHIITRIMNPPFLS